MAKKNLTTTIKDWQEAEAKLGEIKDLSIEMSNKTNDADALIKDIKDAKKKHLDRISLKIKIIQDDLEVFCSQNKADLLPLKSKKTIYGTLGFRNQPKFKWPTVDTLIKRIRQLKLKGYLTVKTTVTADKESIKANYKDLPLEKLGVTRKVKKDVFYIDLSGD